MSESDNLKERIFELVGEYVDRELVDEKWTPGEDWVKYSGPKFDKDEYLAAIESLLSGWLIFGQL